MKALNTNIPRFIHLPMVLDEKGKLLSKKYKSNNLNYYIKHGFLPEAILNYVVRLGWSYKNKEIFSSNELIKIFNIKDIKASASMFNYKKLLWINKYFINNLKKNNLTKHLLYINNKYKINIINNKIILDNNKIHTYTLQEIINKGLYTQITTTIINDNIYDYSNTIIYILKKFNKYFNNKNNIWINNNIKYFINNILKKYNLKFNDIAKIIRITNTYKNCSDPIYNILSIQNKNLTLKKNKNIIEYLLYFINV